jgi:hypothetical protein
MVWQDHLPEDVKDLYDIYDYRHAAAILSREFTEQFQEICQALRTFRFTVEDVTTPGGNESRIPKTFSDILRPLGWREDQLTAKLVVDDHTVSYDTHKVDYIKGRVALDLEWNSKDQTYDRDLYAFRTFFDYDKISLGVLITRSTELDPWISGLGSYVDKNGVTRKYKEKFGASTTQIGKLLPRLQAGRNGGCPVLVFGITTKLLRT